MTFDLQWILMSRRLVADWITLNTIEKFSSCCLFFSWSSTNTNGSVGKYYFRHRLLSYTVCHYLLSLNLFFSIFLPSSMQRLRSWNGNLKSSSIIFFPFCHSNNDTWRTSWNKTPGKIFAIWIWGTITLTINCFLEIIGWSIKSVNVWYLLLNYQYII